VVLAAAGAYFFLHPLLHAIGTGASFVLYLLLSIVGIVILPSFVLWFFGFAWWFIRPYFRAWHINHIRNNRLLREASDRGKMES